VDIPTLFLGVCMTTFKLLRRAAPAGLLVLGAACSSGRTPAGGVKPSAEQTLMDLFNLPALYQRMGRLAASGPMPFIGTVAYVAGRGDSTVTRVGLSFDNHAFAFQRDARTFSTRFRVEYVFVRPAMPPVQAVRDEIVRVESFGETQRSDESIIVEQGFLLAPATYTLTVTVRDPASNVFSRAEQLVVVPAFRAGGTTVPILVYQAQTRKNLTDSLQLVLNPRGTVASGGGDSLTMYVEGYLFPGPTQVPVDVRDERDSVIYHHTIPFKGGRPMEAFVLRLPSDAPPLGELRVSVGEGADAKKTVALVSFSRSWVVTNYDNLLALLRYFPWAPDRLSALRNAKPADRPRLWREFWTATDPVPDTPENEALDRYFTRIAIANERFKDEGGAGWRTDRGEVFVTLGEPDQVLETPPGTDTRLVQWVYNEHRAVISFTGQLGFSRLRMTPTSRAEFSRARAQVMRQGAAR
jgi:GWxTD domain-containing protein